MSLRTLMGLPAASLRDIRAEARALHEICHMCAADKADAAVMREIAQRAPSVHTAAGRLARATRGLEEAA